MFSSRNSVVFVIFVVVLFLAAFFGGVFLLGGDRGASLVTDLPFFGNRQTSETGGGVAGFPVEISLDTPGYLIKPGSFDSDALVGELEKIGLWPLESVQFVGEVGADGVRITEGHNRRITPEKVMIEVRGVGNYGTDLAGDPGLAARQLEVVMSPGGIGETARILSGKFNGDTLVIPLYINLADAESFGQREDNFLSEYVVLAMFLNFRNIASYNDADLFEEFTALVGEMGRPILRVEEVE